MNNTLKATVCNRCQGALRQFCRAEEGVSIPILAIIIVAIIGCAGVAVDGGNVYFQQQRLQIAADAAALDGARLLAKGVNYETLDLKIRAIALKNSADSVDWTLINNERGVAVVAMRDVESYFAKLYGYDEFSVSAEAESQFEPVSKTYDLFPLTVGCDCIEDDMLTLVSDDPHEAEEDLD